MACGLPVICSDWNGYRDTVIDGLSGYLIPTKVFSPVFDSSCVDYISSIDAQTDYCAYIGSTSVIIDEDYAVLKIIDIVSSSTLLQRLSDNALHIGSQYDWSYIFPKYESLLCELSSIRSHFANLNYNFFAISTIFGFVSVLAYIFSINLLCFYC